MKRALAMLLLTGAFASADETRLTETGQIEAVGKEIRVFRGESQSPLFGSVSRENGRLRFTPSLPLMAGETYRVQVRQADGTTRTQRLRLEKTGEEAPTVRMAPFPAILPANALKLYLHFSRPMEHGVFLERITLLRQDGSVVHGAFRETELWSPDGKRLTLWLHPGRQKTGVNLNRDEGPVLITGRQHQLRISGAWRTIHGTPLGQDATFSITAGAVDHECPDPGRWEITPPAAGARGKLVVTLDEGLDPAMLRSSLKVKRNGVVVDGDCHVADDARKWTFVPVQPWQAGTHVIEIDSLLEDLAGNNLQHVFEVDRTQTAPAPARLTRRRFEVMP